VIIGWGWEWDLDWDWATYFHINMDSLHISRKIESRVGDTVSEYLIRGLVWVGGTIPICIDD
jgi:hypothetical protein